MTETTELAARLHLTAERIVEWRPDAAACAVCCATGTGPVSQLVLLDVEETSTDIYREIAEFEAARPISTARAMRRRARSPKSAMRFAWC